MVVRIIRDRRRFPAEMAAFYAMRKKVFHDLFGWDVTPIGPWEIDGYDALEPLYLLSINEAGQVAGGLRLLPTVGFNMLNCTFPQLLPEGKRIESPLIWESSRFTVDRDIDVYVGPKHISRAVAELGIGMNELATRVGLSHIVTVYDAVLHRYLARAGCAGEPIGEPQVLDKPRRGSGRCMVYAAFYEVCAATDRRAREASGIEGSVLEHEGVT